MSNNVLEYKGYWAEIQYSAEDRCLFGKIEAINDLVSFGCENAEEIEKVFHDAVDGYLEDCARHGKNPDKAYKGVFNIRCSPSMHRALATYAIQQSTTLNQVVADAFAEYAHNHNLSMA